MIIGSVLKNLIAFFAIYTFSIDYTKTAFIYTD